MKATTKQLNNSRCDGENTNLPAIQRPDKRKGWTIVELLTVMSIIVILISLLVPALNKARIYAQFVRQNAQFSSIKTALEFFHNDWDGYPDSKVLPLLPGGAAPYTVGAQHLAEALVGRDMQGFDPQSSWNAYQDFTVSPGTIYPVSTAPGYEESLKRRKGPYLDTGNIGVFQMEELYGSGNTGNVYDGNSSPAPVLTDVYRVKSIILANGKTVRGGTPILYYKANVAAKILDATNPTNSIYNIQDNDPLVVLKPPLSGLEPQHHFATDYTDTAIPPKTGTQLFYEAITNPQIRAQVRPYNQDTYILMSAGYDGIFGTRDDVYNFGN